MAKIVSIGSALQDIYLIDRDDFVACTVGNVSIFGKIEIGTKVDIDKIMYQSGGGGTNSAVTFARNGHETVYIGNIAKDASGEAIIAELDSEGVDTTYIGYARKATGLSIVMLDAKSGERTILTHRGASARFDNLNPSVLEEIRPDWIYITTLHGDMETIESFIVKAKNLNAKIMFNPGEKEIENIDRILSILPSIDILLVNKKEASKIVPGAVLSELSSHLANYCDTVIVTEASNGGICRTPESVYRFGVYEDVKVKDSTGAGDAFGSGFLSAYARNKKIEDCIVFASANSTSVISNIGAKRGILNGLGKLHQMPIQKV